MSFPRGCLLIGSSPTRHTPDVPAQFSPARTIEVVTSPTPRARGEPAEQGLFEAWALFPTGLT
jgi:hypothetical protein